MSLLILAWIKPRGKNHEATRTLGRLDSPGFWDSSHLQKSRSPGISPPSLCTQSWAQALGLTYPSSFTVTTRAYLKHHLRWLQWGQVPVGQPAWCDSASSEQSGFLGGKEVVGWEQSLEGLQLIHTSVGPPLGLDTALLLVRIRCKFNEWCCEAGTLLSILAIHMAKPA